MNVELAEMSKTLFNASVLLFFAAMLGYLYAMATTKVAIADGPQPASGRLARTGATWLTAAGMLTLGAHVITRGIASERLPLGNMFEFSTLMALTVVGAGLFVVQWRMRRPELMGFVLLGTILTMGAALLVYTEPGPLMPILTTAWRAIHVGTIVFAAGLFTVSFVFAGLYLLRERAERALQEAAPGGSVGAARVVDLAYDGAVDADVVPQRQSPDVDDDPTNLPPRSDLTAQQRATMRAATNPVSLGLGTFLATTSIAWVFWVEDGVARFASVVIAMVAAALIARWSVPYLPSAATLDRLTYRTIAFAFPVWTFAVISGAIWAEQSWGRYWGWDPKETSAFLTWVAYAGYLHARATRGMKGRNAGWLAILGFAVLMFTYYVVNLVVTNTLHGYA